MTHKLIHTPHYLLAVDDSEIKEGEYCINLQDKGNNIFPFMDMRNIGIDYNKKVIKKIIAHLPLNNSPILTGVDLLPPFSRHQEDGIEELAHTEYRVSLQPIGRTLAGGKYDVDINYESRIGFIKGYNKAKEKYKYTEDDIRKAIRYGFDVGFCSNSSNKTKNDLQSEETFIQSLSQPKMPVEFECETITMNKGYTDEKDYPYQECEIPKTTTNSRGQTVWVGKYIFPE